MYLGGNCRWVPLTTAPSKPILAHADAHFSPWQISAIKWTVLALIKGVTLEPKSGQHFTHRTTPFLGLKQIYLIYSVHTN